MLSQQNNREGFYIAQFSRFLVEACLRETEIDNILGLKRLQSPLTIRVEGKEGKESRGEVRKCGESWGTKSLLPFPQANEIFSI